MHHRRDWHDHWSHDGGVSHVSLLGCALHGLAVRTMEKFRKAWWTQALTSKRRQTPAPKQRALIKECFLHTNHEDTCRATKDIRMSTAITLVHNNVRLSFKEFSCCIVFFLVVTSYSHDKE